VQII